LTGIHCISKIIIEIIGNNGLTISPGKIIWKAGHADVTCYVIHPEYRKQGVARLLLKHAIEGFKIQDFDEVIALPVDSKLPVEMHYRGTMNMYLENGFKVVECQEDVNFMILDLKKINR
jgi:GNAT superfamily N-acetyltransferase